MLFISRDSSYKLNDCYSSTLVKYGCNRGLIVVNESRKPSGTASEIMNRALLIFFKGLTYMNTSQALLQFVFFPWERTVTTHWDIVMSCFDA